MPGLTENEAVETLLAHDFFLLFGVCDLLEQTIVFRQIVNDPIRRFVFYASDTLLSATRDLRAS